MSRLTPYARHARVAAGTEPGGPRARAALSPAEVFAEWERLRREQVAVRAAMYRASWEQVLQRIRA